MTATTARKTGAFLVGLLLAATAGQAFGDSSSNSDEDCAIVTYRADGTMTKRRGPADDTARAGNGSASASAHGRHASSASVSASSSSSGQGRHSSSSSSSSSDGRTVTTTHDDQGCTVTIDERGT